MPSVSNYILEFSVGSGLNELQRLVRILIDVFGVETKIVVVQVARRADESELFSVGIEGSQLPSDQLCSNIRSHFSNKPVNFKVTLRKGFNALCAELLDRGSIVFTWGVGILEVRARARASTTKVNLQHATRNILESGMEDHMGNLHEQEGLEHLYLWVRSRHFPAPYSRADLGSAKHDILLWLGRNLVIPRKIGSFQLCILGPADSQKTLLFFCR